MGKGASKEKQNERDALAQTLREDPMDLIQKNYILLTDHLDVGHVVETLYQQLVLNHAEFDELNSEAIGRRTTKMLLTLLRKKPPSQIHKFIDILKKHQPFLYNMMVSNSIHANGPHFEWLDNKDQQCEPCLEQESKVVATSWCYQCCEALCANCAKIHTSMKLLRHHSVKKISDIRAALKDSETDESEMPQNSEKSKQLTIKASLCNTIPISFKGDKEGSASAIDVAHTTINKTSILLVCDWHNESVKSFTEIGTKIKCKRLQMAGCPLRIAKTSSNEIAVTVARSCRIIIIQIGIGVLRKISEIKTSKTYEAISYLGGGMFAVIGSTLDIINVNGEILKTLDSDGTGSCNFTNSEYLSTNPGKEIIVSDPRNCRVVCVDQKAEVQWIYQTQVEPKMECPNGVCCDKNGNVYVADWDRHNVLCLSHGGTFKQIVVSASNRLYRPRSVCVSDKGDKLYVAEDCGPVKVYKLILS